MLLWRGRHPRLASAYLVPEEPIVSAEERRLFRRPFEPMPLLRLRLWWSTKRGQADDNGVFETARALLTAVVTRWVNSSNRS